MSDYNERPVVSTRARDRRRRSAITLVSVLLLLFFAFWYAYSYYRSATTSTTQTLSTPCATVTAGQPNPATTTVNVYNATSRNGLAAATAKEIKARGFTVGKIANDPLHQTVKGPAQVRYGPAGASRAALVRDLIGKGVVMVKDKRTDTSVDLVLGDGFNSLVAAPTPSAAATPTCTTTVTPTPSGSSSASPSS